MGRRRHQRRTDHGEPGAAPGRGWSAGTLPFPRCSRSRSSRPLQESARRLAEHGGGSRDPQQDRPPLHRADNGGRAQSRRARSDCRLRARSPRRQGLEPLLSGADWPRAVRVGHHVFAVRRGSRLALPNPEEVRPPDAREREVRSPLHQDRSGECRSTAFRARPGPRPIRFRRLPNRRACPSGPTPEAPAGALQERITWGYVRTEMSRLAPISPSSRGRFAARVLRTSGRRRGYSQTFAGAPRSADGAGSAR